jgi:hypothetical protein
MTERTNAPRGADYARERRHTPQSLMAAARASRAEARYESAQVEKTRSRYTYTDGPMLYVLQHIERAMQDAGYPCKIHEYYRRPEDQAAMLEKGVSKAGPYQSAHQYYCAGDLIHPAKGWNVTEDYWDTLAACVRNVSLQLVVDLDHGHYWNFRDSAHIQWGEWRDFRALIGEREPDRAEIRQLWELMLPGVLTPDIAAKHGL